MWENLIGVEYTCTGILRNNLASLLASREQFNKREIFYARKMTEKRLIKRSHVFDFVFFVYLYTEIITNNQPDLTRNKKGNGRLMFLKVVRFLNKNKTLPNLFFKYGHNLYGTISQPNLITS